MPEQTEEANVDAANEETSTEENMSSVGVWEPTESDELKEEFKDEYNKEELQDKVQERNEEKGVTQYDAGYIPASGTKEKIAEALSREVLMEEGDGPIAPTSTEIQEGVKLRQLETHPQNERFSVDYKDPKLYNSIKMSGDFTNVPIVTPVEKSDGSGELAKNQYDEVRYRIVGGNRSVETLKDFLDNEVDFENETEYDSKDEYEINVLVKTYESDDDEKNWQQELIDITNDNEASLEPSPISRARQYKRMNDAGWTQKAIANESGKRQSQISRDIQMIELLPERVTELIHYDYHSARLSKLDEETLKKEGVPFRTNSSGDIVVEGMTQSNADVMMGMLKEFGEDEQVKLDLEDLFVDGDTLKKACEMTKDQFDQWLHERAVESGILSEKVLEDSSQDSSGDTSSTSDDQTGTEQSGDSQSASSPSPEDVEQTNVPSPSGDDSGDTSTSASGDSSTTSDSDMSDSDMSDSDTSDDDGTKSIRAQINDQPFNNDQAAEELRNGDVELADEFFEIFADALELNQPKSLDAFKTLYYHGVIVDSEE